MKTPILRPATEAVLFGFERIGMVIRIAWLPIVLVIGLYAGSYCLLAGGVDLRSFHPSGADPKEMMRSFFETPGFAGFYALQMTVLPLLSSLVLSCVYVAVTRASTLAEYEPPRLPFYFALGPREIRYFITRILYALLIIVVTVAIGAVGAGVVATALAIVGASSVHGHVHALVMAPIAAIVVCLALVWLWIVLRFLPVLPIAAVENRIAFGDAWKLTKGNFWRLLFSGVLFVAMLEALLIAFMIAVMTPAVIIVALVVGFGAGVAGPAALIALALLAIVAVPVFIAVAAFALAARAAWPARIYAYLSDCGDACKI